MVEGEPRTIMHFDPKIAPVKAAIFPLIKKPELIKVAEDIFKTLSKRWNVEYDESGAVGKRYRRQDEIGTPYCITVDFETIEKDNMVTIRDRDTTEQQRIAISEVEKYLEEKLK
jgi:glycyl-tRNA synthetase